MIQDKTTPPPPDANDPSIRRRRGLAKSVCAEALVADGNAPNIDCADDMVSTVFWVLRKRFGVEIGDLINDQ